MAELAAATSVAGLISLTLQVIQLSKDYIVGVRNASKTIKNYLRELEIMQLVLQEFQAFVLSNISSPASYTALQACTDELELLKSKLERRIGSTSTTNRFNRLTWPFAEAETKTITEVLHRYQSSLHMLLTAQNHRLATSTLSAIDRIEARQEQEVKERIVRWLSVADPLSNHTAARDKHEPSTGDWFLTCDEFISWKSNPSINIWIRSIAGAGKTILCSTIVDHLLHQQSAEDFVLFYYFDFRNDRKQSLRSLLLSLIAQICVRADSVPQRIEDAFHEGALLDTRSLTEMFTELALECGHVKIVVDALDESTETSLLLRVLADVANHPSEVIQWLVTSRSQQCIETALESCSPVIVSLNKTLVNDDIRLFVESCLIRDSVLRSRPSWVQDLISETLLFKADGMYGHLSQISLVNTLILYSPHYTSISGYSSSWSMGSSCGQMADILHRFQYVVCQLSVLRSCLTGPAIEAALDDLPAGIDETYDRMLLSISRENRGKVRRALLLIAFSARPIRFEEVAEIAACSVNYRPFDPGDRLFNPKDIIGLAAGLVVYDEVTDSLILAHYSVQEYLLSTRITRGLAHYFALNEVEAHRYITQASVLYMLSVADMTVGYHGITQDYPFLQYAAAYWVQHARPSLTRNADNVIIELVLHVLDGRNGAYKFWLTYHDTAGKNRTVLESLFEYLHGPELLRIFRHPGFLYLPSDLLVPELCVLFARVGVSYRSATSAQAIIDVKTEILKIIRGLAHPKSKFSRLKMFSNLCGMDAGDAAPNWTTLNEAMYLALFEPLDLKGQGNLPEKLSVEEVVQVGEQLEHYIPVVEARGPHGNRFSHVLDYIKERVSQEHIEQNAWMPLL